MKFGKLTVVNFVRYGNTKGNRLFLCRCDCGRELEVWNSCFYRDLCCCRECMNEIKGRHGMPHHPLLGMWQRRCRHVPGWESFRVFVQEVGEKPFPEATIGPVEYGGEVTRETWKWVDYRDLAAMNCAHKITVLGITHSKSDWAGICKVTKERMRQRLEQFDPVGAVSCYPSAVEYFRQQGLGDEVTNWPGARFLEVMDGQIHHFVWGKDYTTSIPAIRQQLHTYAKQYGRKVTIRAFGKDVMFQFEPTPEPSKPTKRKKAG